MTTSIHQAQSIPQFCTEKQTQNQINPSRMFRQLSNIIAQHPFARSQAREKVVEESSLKLNQNTIKPKMFLKVLTWMARLCQETLQFSDETFQISVRILKKYLQKSSQSPNTLQMLACISLHLASKINEKTIISIESYRECCLNIFTKKEFESKEIQVCDKIQFEIYQLTFQSALNFLNSQIIKKELTQSQEEKIKTVLRKLTISLDFLQIQPFTLITNLIVEASCGKFEAQIDYLEFFNLVKIRKVQY